MDKLTLIGEDYNGNFKGNLIEKDEDSWNVDRGGQTTYHWKRYNGSGIIHKIGVEQKYFFSFTTRFCDTNSLTLEEAIFGCCSELVKKVEEGNKRFIDTVLQLIVTRVESSKDEIPVIYFDYFLDNDKVEDYILELLEED